MAGKRFTDSYLSGLQPRQRPYKVRDKLDYKGLGLQVSTRGTKTFFLAYTTGGKEHYLSLGHYVPKSGKRPSNLTDVRELGRQLRALVDQGKDPRQWLDAQNTSYGKGTFGDLLDTYLQSLGTRPSAKHAGQIFSRDIRTAIDPGQPANAVTPEMVTNALRRILKRGAGTQANRAHSYLHAAFRYGLLYDNDPSASDSQIRFYLSVNPVTAVRRPTQRESTGETNLSFDEIKQFWRELARYNGMSNDAKNALRLLIITGQRVEVILGCTVQELDLSSGVWDVPAKRMKTGRAHVVPIHAMAAEIFSEQIAVHASDKLFPNSRDPGRSMIPNSLSRAVSRFCEKTDFPKFTPRDLRRTWTTRTAEIGISKQDRQRVQAHSVRSDVSGKHYDRYDYLAEKVAAMDAWCNVLNGLVHDANITPLRKA